MFTRENKYTKSFNKDKTSSPIMYQVLKFIDLEHPNIKKILNWCSENCKFRYDICQWHLGYDNNIFLRFHSKEDYNNFYTFYDSNFLSCSEILYLPYIAKKSIILFNAD